jgi:hypothetical protein
MVALKTSYDGGTSPVVLSPMAFMGRLGALDPKPRVNLSGIHGGLSPRRKLRKHAVLRKPNDDPEPVVQLAKKAYSLAWAQRLKWVFAIEPNAAR